MVLTKFVRNTNSQRLRFMHLDGLNFIHWRVPTSTAPRGALWQAVKSSSGSESLRRCSAESLRQCHGEVEPGPSL